MSLVVLLEDEKFLSLEDIPVYIGQSTYSFPKRYVLYAWSADEMEAKE